MGSRWSDELRITEGHLELFIFRKAEIVTIDFELVIPCIVDKDYIPRICKSSPGAYCQLNRGLGWKTLIPPADLADNSVFLTDKISPVIFILAPII